MESIPVSEQRRAQVEALARQQGRHVAETADDLLALGLEQQALEHEADDIRKMLDGRYDEAISSTANLLTPDEACRQLSERHEAYLRRR